MFGSSKQYPRRLLEGDWNVLGSSILQSLDNFCHRSKSYASSLTWGHSNFIPWSLVDFFFVPSALTPCPALSPTSFCWRLITAWGNSILGMFCDLEILSLITAFTPEKESAESCPASAGAAPRLGSHRGHFWLTGAWKKNGLLVHTLSSSRKNTWLERSLSCF